MTKSRAWRGCLEVMDTFGVHVTQSVLGGEKLQHSDRRGDLQIVGSFIEVKTSGLSNGPIIEEEQLQRNYEDSFPHDYVFLCYKNRGDWRGTTRNLPLRIFRNQGRRGLEDFLIRNTKILYVFPVSVIWALYEKAKNNGRVVTYDLKTGPKTYFRVRYPDLKAITGHNHSEAMRELDLEPRAYSLAIQPNIAARFDRCKVPLRVARITAVPVEADDSFDIRVFERLA